MNKRSDMRSMMYLENENIKKILFAFIEQTYWTLTEDI